MINLILRMGLRSYFFFCKYNTSFCIIQYFCFILVTLSYGGGGIGAPNAVHTYIRNIRNALSQIDNKSVSFQFDRNGAEKCPDSGSHIQGVAYYDGYYYTRSRPVDKNYQQLLIVKESEAKVVNNSIFASYLNLLIYNKKSSILFA